MKKRISSIPNTMKGKILKQHLLCHKEFLELWDWIDDISEVVKDV